MITERVLTCRGPDGQVVEEFASAAIIGFHASDDKDDDATWDEGASRG